MAAVLLRFALAIGAPAAAAAGSTFITDGFPGLRQEGRAPSGPGGQPVVVDNFHRAESDQYFADFARQGALGQFVHMRAPVRVEEQTVVRMNQDTLYSYLLLDLRFCGATVTFPPTDGRFASLLPISEDHDIFPAKYEAGEYSWPPADGTQTPYMLILIRTFVIPSNTSDLRATHSIQDGFKVQQMGSTGFELPDWSQTDLTTIRKALKVLGATTVTPPKEMFGLRRELDRESHDMGTAMGWGGNRPADATYYIRYPERSDGVATYTLNVKDVPIVGNGFWSVTVYNASGYMEGSPNSFNDKTAVRNADGGYTISFGGCGGESRRNCLPVMRGWNYVVRLYRPGPPILHDTWHFPDAVPDAESLAPDTEASAWTAAELLV